ncbi:MAG: hypothetical protein AVDCRST_MAG64-2653 [uncultured Phycisphaerae bacterium]|uniref:Uncharacterized protein n=1 Tax=uncultured Phycisphaerae bacterium TaxID=904963 RepID=A0A6J4PM89_9BACT|nr:MAG: hypothetical protein AVDCRST_MAG64-2653 [uncultured Phycisphaerae bacterium]
MQQSHGDADSAETRILARGGGGVAGDLQVELLQRANGSVAVTFALAGDAGAAHEWEAGNVEHGVRTFLSLVRRRTPN